MKRNVILLLAILTGIFSGVNKASASHSAGMDMFYRWVNNNQYEFTLIFYRNCLTYPTTPSPAPPSVIFQARAASINSNGSFNGIQLPTAGTGVPPLNPSNMYNCTESQNALCYEEYVYRGMWTSPAPATDWRFSYELCCRPGPPPFPNPPTNILYDEQFIECGLNNFDFPDTQAKNWSPLWHNRRPNHPGYSTDTLINYLFRTMCSYNYYSIDMSVKEYQGDSISYGFYVPQGGGGAPVTYNPPWTFSNPLPTIPPASLTINPITGIIPVTPGAPTGTGIYVLGIEAKEWRYDTIVSGGVFIRVAKQIGYVRRDMTIWIDDTTNCKRDSVHPKNVTITNGGGQTTLDVYFSNGVSTGNSQVRCATLSPDGSEFRVIDSSNYVAPFDTTVRSIGVHKATWNCHAGLASKVTLHLAEPLRCQEYYIYLKIGTDLDVLESECGFLEPDSVAGKVTVTKNVNVKIDTLGNLLSYCLPTTNPFPKIRATSTDTASFPLDYYWAYRCDTCPANASGYDTIDGQNVPYTRAQQPGWYEVRVRDPFNCTGKRNIRVVFDTVPQFNMDFPLYCDKYGETPTLPEFLVAPQDPDVYLWEWESILLGKVETGDTIRVPKLIEGMRYKLKGTKFPKIPGAKACSNEFEFVYSRDSFPPQDPLYVKFLDESTALCLSDADSGVIEVWQEGLRDKYSPLFVQWYLDTMPIPGSTLQKVVRDTGKYIVMVVDSLGCWGLDTTLVTTDERIPGPIVPCNVAGSNGIFTFIWPEGVPVYQNQVSLDEGLTWIDANQVNFHVVGNIQSQKSILAKGLVHAACYETEITTSLECPDEVFPPNVITPNGDGLNDLFKIGGLELFGNSKVEVFDRWGNRVFASDDYKNDWDGGDLPEGTYYYILEVDDPQQTVHRGILTILR